MTALKYLCVFEDLFTSISGAFSLNCMVGTGDMWEVPKSASDIKKGNYPTMDAPFKSYKCGERGSQIAIIDTMIKNVTDNIVQAQYID